MSYVAENEGDPNDGFDPSVDESEVQYFIKWKGWAHIHNTWDSEKSLREQKVNGLKRLDNYIKKEEMLSNWLLFEISFCECCNNLIPVK